jgi:hypothetical protein
MYFPVSLQALLEVMFAPLQARGNPCWRMAYLQCISRE